ncbi:MrpF/PhaF family protein [uncultured Actinomyces sp.]|uniref:MrpF/PhaF family protein n=1 Tax=uncultured Actinomyces sp. TaxID=249061 RepID=UPI00261CF009|nr:MrpF/PhaF family protein [uncultured Actinomyces sp.]
MSTVINVILFVALMAMIATAFMTLVRLTLGPSIMDRAVASDVLAVASAGITLVLAVRTDRTDVLVLAIMFAMVGFMYSVTLGRFSERPRETTDAATTPEQLRAQEVRLMREAQSELHAEEREAILAAREAQAAAQTAKNVADAGERAKNASKMTGGKHD